MDCPRCNAPLPQDATFCFNCGLTLTSDTREINYPQPQPPSPSPYDGQSGYSPAPSQPQAPYYPPAYSQPFSQPPYPGPASQPFAMNPAGVQSADMSTPGEATARRMTMISWTPLIILAVALVALTGSFLVAANIGDKSWTSGDLAAAIAAFGVATLALATVIVQLVRRQWRRLSFAFNLLLLVSLALLGTGGIVFKAQVGMAQAQHFGAVGDWADALKVYALLAKDPACGQDCQRAVRDGEAHAHYEYGYQLDGAKKYQAAISQFKAALADSPAELDAVLAHVELSHAHYSFGLQFVTQHYYLEGISEFEQAVAAAPSGPFARQAHLAAASAYYSIWTQDKSGLSCENAVMALQQIVKNYADAPEAKEAAADLVAPVTVTGTITGYPVNPTLEVFLSKSANVPKCCGNPVSGANAFSEDYHTMLDPKTGTYVFHDVLPGSYTVSTLFQSGSYTSYTWWYPNSDLGTGPLFMQVGPVCPFTWTTLPCDGGCG